MSTKLPTKYHGRKERKSVAVTKRSKSRSFHHPDGGISCCSSSSSSSYASVPLCLGNNLETRKKGDAAQRKIPRNMKRGRNPRRDRKRSKTPSWSDSDGSTYVSGMHEKPLNQDFLASIENRQVSWTLSDTEDLDAMLEFDDKPSVDSNDCRRLSKDSRSKVIQQRRELTWVTRYSNVDEASDASDLSTMESLQKEDAESIFCKRLIPLTIPAKTGVDDISGVSIANDPSEVINHFSSNVSAKNLPVRLKNVDYVVAFDIAADHQDISTVGYKIPYPIAHKAFDRTKLRIANMQSFEVPNLIERTASASTISSLDNDSFCAFDHVEGCLDDGRSDEATRPVRTEDFSSNKKIHSTPAVPDEKRLPLKDDDESSADARIRDLKKKIRELQSSISSPTNKQTHATSTGNEQNRRPLATDVMDKRILELTRTTKELRKKRGSNFVCDPTGGLELSGSPISNVSEHEHRISGLPSVEVRISQRSNSLAFGEGPFPVVIPAENEEDEVSTMDGCTLRDGYRGEAADIENALRSAIERRRKKLGTYTLWGLNSVVGDAFFYLTLGKEKIVGAASKSTEHKLQPVEAERQSPILEVWEKSMGGRSKGERVLIGVISVSLLVLFVLLTVILVGK